MKFKIFRNSILNAEKIEADMAEFSKGKVVESIYPQLTGSVICIVMQYRDSQPAMKEADAPKKSKSNK